MPNGMDSGSANALQRNKINSSNKYTLGPSTFGISVSSDMDNTENWASGAGQSNTNPGTYYPLTGVGQSTYVSGAEADSAMYYANNAPYPGWEIDVVNGISQ